MATPTFDLSGLPLLENAVAALVVQQAAAPTSFTGGQTFNVKFQGLPGTQTMTVAQLIGRIQALLLTAQSLPQ